MNENKRILLLALGIGLVLASDPPVASYFERPQTACRIATELAVSAFDSLVRSTLPRVEAPEEGERSDEVLVTAPKTMTSAPAPPTTLGSRSEKHQLAFREHGLDGSGGSCSESSRPGSSIASESLPRTDRPLHPPSSGQRVAEGKQVNENPA